MSISPISPAVRTRLRVYQQLLAQLSADQWLLSVSERALIAVLSHAYAGTPPHTLQRALRRRFGELPPRERVLSDLALKCLTGASRLGETDFAYLRAYGLGEDEVQEAIEAAALFTFGSINRISNAFDLLPEPTSAAECRAPAPVAPVPLPYFFEGNC